MWYYARTWYIVVSHRLFAIWNPKSINFIYSHIKLIYLFWILNKTFIYEGLETSLIGHLENTGSLSYAELLNVDTFYYTI